MQLIKTKRNLYDGLLQLLCKQPFEEIKIKDICDISLTSRSTFYDHFSDKYELLASLIEDLKKELNTKLNENKKEVRDFITKYNQKYMKILRKKFKT